MINQDEMQVTYSIKDPIEILFGQTETGQDDRKLAIVPAFCQSHVSYDTRPDRSYQQSSATKRHRVRANRYRLTLTI